MCSGDMYTDHDLNALWYLALRRLPLVELQRFLDHLTAIRGIGTA